MLLQPKSIGPLTIRRKLGSDGVSEQYEGVLQVDAVRDVRIHRLNDWVTSDPPLLRAVEARIGDLLALRHPRLMRILDYVAHGDERYLVEEVVAGVDLDELVQRLDERGLKMPRHVFVHLAMQLCTSLEALHNRSGSVTGARVVLHRAMRPGAVHLGLDGSIRLGGFGLLPSPKLVPRSSRRGPVSARTAFLAPEQVDESDDLEPSATTDIFSLGATLYTMLTGGILFDAASDLQAIHRIRRGDIGKALSVTRRILPGVAPLLTRCLSVSPADRFEDVHAVRAALQELDVDLDASRITDDVLDLLAAIDLEPPSRMHREPEPIVPTPLVNDLSEEETVELDAEDEPTAQDMRIQYDGDFDDSDFEDDTATDPGILHDYSGGHAAEFAASLIGQELNGLDGDDLAAFDDIEVSASHMPAPLPINIGPSFRQPETEPEHTATSVPSQPEVTAQRVEITQPETEQLRNAYENTVPTPPPVSLPSDAIESIEPAEDTLPPLEYGRRGPTRNVLLSAATMALAFTGGALLAWAYGPSAELVEGDDGRTTVLVASAPETPKSVLVETPVAKPATPVPEAVEAPPPPEATPAPTPAPVAEVVARQPEPVKVAKATPTPTPAPAPAPVEAVAKAAPVEAPKPPVATPTPKPATDATASTWKPPERLRDAEALGGKAAKGDLSAAERAFLDGIAPSHPDFARAKMWLYEDATKRKALADRKRHIEALISVPSYASNPVYLVEAAEVAYAYSDYRGTIDYAKKVDRTWGRLPQSVVHKRKTRIYELAARSWSKLATADASALDDARQAWSKYRTHVSSNPNLVQRADEALAKLTP